MSRGPRRQAHGARPALFGITSLYRTGRMCGRCHTRCRTSVTPVGCPWGFGRPAGRRRSRRCLLTTWMGGGPFCGTGPARATVRDSARQCATACDACATQHDPGATPRARLGFSRVRDSATPSARRSARHSARQRATLRDTCATRHDPCAAPCARQGLSRVRDSATPSAPHSARHSARQRAPGSCLGSCRHDPGATPCARQGFSRVRDSATPSARRSARHWGRARGRGFRAGVAPA